MNSIRYSCITALSLLLSLIFAPSITAQQAVPPPENRIDVAQIPLPEVSTEMIGKMRDLLDSLPPVRMGWLDSYPFIDGKYYFGGIPYDQQFMDSALSLTEETPHTSEYWFGLRRQFPEKVKERILASQPASIDALLSIMIDDMAAPFLQVPTVLSALWGSLSMEQQDMYLRHHIQPYFEMKPRYEMGEEAFINAGSEMRLLWPATEPVELPSSSTNIYLDGNLVKAITGPSGNQYGPGIIRSGASFNVLSVKVSSLGLGQHTIRSETKYEFVCEGRTYAGVCDSGEVPFEVIQPFLPNQLAAQPDPHIDRLVREHVKFLEINPRSIWTKEVAEIIAWEPTYSNRVNDSEGYAFHLPVLRIDQPLPVSLAHDVEFHLLDNGEIFAGSPVTLSNSAATSMRLSISAISMELNLGTVSGPKADKFVAGREGYVPLRIVLTPSERHAKYYKMDNYYNKKIVSGILRARVHHFNPTAIEEYAQPLKSIADDFKLRALSQIAENLAQGSTSTIISLRRYEDYYESAVVPFLVHLLDIPETGFMEPVPRTAMNELVWIGAPAVEALSRALNDESAQTRKYAALGLEAMEIPKAHNALAAAKSSPDPEVRRIASSAEFVEDIEAPLHIADPALRRAILRALKKDSGPFTLQEIAEARITSVYIYPIRDGTEVTLCKSLEGIEACRDLTKLSIAENDLEDIGPVAALSKLDAFSIGRGNVVDFSPLQSLERLERIHVEHNPKADIESICNLKWLRFNVELIGLGISDLRPLTRLTNVGSFSLRDNNISDVSPLAKLTKVNAISLSGNPVRNVRPLARLPILSRLRLARTDIQNVEFVHDMPKLYLLDIADTNITDLSPIAAAPALKTLILNGLQIDDIGAITNETLESISFSDTQVADLRPLQRFPNLKRFHASKAQIRDISPLATLYHLEHLFLSGNFIEDASPLAKLTNLAEVDLSDNQIMRLPSFEDPSALRQLLLYKNRIVDIEPLLNLSPSTHVMISSNLLDCRSIDEHLPALAARGVNVYYAGYCISSIDPDTAAVESVRVTISVHRKKWNVFMPRNDMSEFPRSIYLRRDGAADIQGTDLKIVATDTVECTFALGMAPRGIWHLYIETRRGGGALMNAFTIR